MVLATAFGLLRALTDGRFRGTHVVRGADRSAGPDRDPGADRPRPRRRPHRATGRAALPSVLEGTGLDVSLGDRATLLQFSSAFCAPCRVARRTLGEVAELVPGVVHHEVDAEHHLELVRRLGVLRTPTTLVLDAAGAEVARASGAPRRDEVLATLARVTSG